MKKITLVSSMAAALSLLLARGALAAVNPAAPNPYPTRESKLLADFESAAMVTSDPNGTGRNLASINTNPQFVAEGSKSLKLDLNGVAAGWQDPDFAINFVPPIEIKGYQVLSRNVLIPDASLKIDLTGHLGGFTNNVARADDWGTTLDASKAMAIHLDFFVPPGSYTATDFHDLGFGVVSDGGEVSGLAHGVVDGQWIALEIP